MSLATDSTFIDCPYCGENFELVVDPGVEHQEYIEDCFVCCQPISLTATITDGQLSVTAKHENE